MRPRNDRERLVMKLSAKLPEISKQQMEWARKHCINHYAYSLKNQAWCSECGQDFPITAAEYVKGRRVTCPHCGSHLKVEKTRKQSEKESIYYTTLAHIGGFQVLRHYVIKTLARRHHTRETSFDEVVQRWLDYHGTVVVARPVYMCTYDLWNFYTPLSIKADANRYNIWAFRTYPRGGVLPILRRNGYFAKLEHKAKIPPQILMEYLLTDNFAEMLVKTKQYALLNYYYKSYCHLNFPHAINICNRNGYIVKDASMWVDYLELLDYFGLDTHNAHYVCPRDLKAEHDRLMVKKQKIEEHRKKEDKARETRRFERAYRRVKGKYFGICFGNDKIVVTVIGSVKEMAEEGIAMHHCVYAMKYFQKKNSLILSAKDKEGTRLETVEVNLKSFDVVQSRGKYNLNSSYHNEIIELVEKNMHLIRQIV